MAYIVGVSSGYFTVAEAREKIELLGLFKKAQSSITKGVQFVQLDLESISEFEEPNLKERMEKEIREKLGISYGIHSETRAAGVEAAELDSAIGTEYERGHRRLVDIIKKSGEIGAKYVLIHASESDPFPLVALKVQPAELVDFYGRPFNIFLEENPWLIDWVVEGKGKFLWVEILGREIDEYLKEVKESTKEDYIRIHLDPLEREYREGRIPKEVFEREKEIIQKRAEERGNEEAKRVKERLRERLKEWFYSRDLRHGPERWAYYLVGKWMEKNKDPLWEKIVKVNIEFFAARDKKNVEEWVREKGISLDKLSLDDETFRRFHELWVPAVAAKYIWGHLNPKEIKFEDPKKFLKKYKMVLTIETPMGGRGIEEWLRFYNPLHIYCLCEEVGTEYLQLAIDIEHMLSIRVDPELVIKLLPENAGKFVRVIHAGWPAAIAPAHMPILLGSEQQEYLYRILYKLREKGFGLDISTDYYIIFERGAPETFQESIISLKRIAECLEKNIPPENLPLEFRGISPKEIGAIERQLAIIREHAFEPLKGLIVVPEEAHEFLGEEAKKKGKIEEWRRERYR